MGDEAKVEHIYGKDNCPHCHGKLPTLEQQNLLAMDEMKAVVRKGIEAEVNAAIDAKLKPVLSRVQEWIEVEMDSDEFKHKRRNHKTRMRVKELEAQKEVE